MRLPSHDFESCVYSQFHHSGVLGIIHFLRVFSMFFVIENFIGSRYSGYDDANHLYL